MSTSLLSIPAPARQTVSGTGEFIITRSRSVSNLAITRCCKAWNQVFRANKAMGANPVSCYIRANEAYRATMPPLTDDKNIRNFIACTAFGMMTGPVDILLGPKLLYAAQVATSMYRSKSAQKNTASKSARKTKKPRAERLPRTKRA